MYEVLRFLARRTVLLILVVLFVIFSLARPATFLSGLNAENVARQISFDSLIALGETLVLIGGGIDLSVGSVLSMASALTMALQPAGVGVACLAALIFGGLTGVVNGLLVTRAKVVPFIATLGTMTVVRGIMLTYTRQEPIPGTVEWFSDIGNGTLGPVPIPTVILIGIVLILYVVMTRTRFGRNLYAAGGNAEASKLAGIQPDHYKFWSYVICGALAALAGILLASRLNSATIHIGLDTPLLVLTAAIMGGASLTGGRGSILGTMLGIITLAILVNGMDLLAVNSFYQTAVRAILLLIVVVLDAFYALRLKERVSRRAIGRQDDTTATAKSPVGRA
jgi:ribose transport system permease protein